MEIRAHTQVLDARSYFILRDRIITVFDFHVQQRSNTLLYHVLNISTIDSNERVDRLGSELKFFVLEIINSVKNAKVIFTVEGSDLIDYFIQILSKIKHQYVDECINLLIKIRQYINGQLGLPQQEELGLLKAS